MWVNTQSCVSIKIPLWSNSFVVKNILNSRHFLLASYGTQSPFLWNISFISIPVLVAETVKNLPTIRETWVQFLVQEDPPEKRMATHSIILACRVPETEESGYSQWNCRVSDTTEPLTLLTHSTVFIVVFVVWCIFLNSPAFLYLAPWMASISLPNLFALVLTWHVALGPVFFLSITAPCWPHPILSH